MSTITPIQEKIKEKEAENSNLPRENWKRFAYLSLFSFLIILGVGLLGANFMYITSLTPTSLDRLLPSKDTDYFDESVLKGGGASGIDSDYSCSSGSGTGSLGAFNNSFSFLPSKGFPYSMKKPSAALESFPLKFKNWFANTCAESFMTSRSILKMWLRLFSKNSALGNHTIQMLFIAPLTLSLGSGIAFIVGLFSTILALYNSSGFLGLMVGFLLLYNFVFISTLSTIQVILFIMTFLFLPLILDFKKVIHILHCNSSILTTLFGLVTCISAFLSFESTTAAIYTVLFVLMTVISFLFS